MLTIEELKTITEKYNVDGEKLVHNNFGIILNGSATDIELALNVLVTKWHMPTKSIEECPTVLFQNVEYLDTNLDFLSKNTNLMKNVEHCLHILGTPSTQLQETYNYVLEQYGEKTLKRIISILRVPVTRIKGVEDVFSEKKVKNQFACFGAALSKLTISEIADVIDICRNNGVKIKGSVFDSNPDNLMKLIDLCKNRNLDINKLSAIFRKDAKSILAIINKCTKLNINIANFIFYRTPEEIYEIYKLCEKHEIDSNNVPMIFSRKPQEVRDILDICHTYGIKLKSSIFKNDPKKLEDIAKVCKKYGISINKHTTIFKRSAEELDDIFKLCNQTDLKMNNLLFNHTANEIVDICSICKRLGIDYNALNSVFLADSNELENIINTCKTYNINYKKVPRVFTRTSDEIIDIVEGLKSMKNGLSLLNSPALFRKPPKEAKDILKVCAANNIKACSMVFRRNVYEIEEIVDICNKYGININDNALIFLNTPRKAKAILDTCNELKIKVSSNVFRKNPKELRKIFKLLKINKLDASNLATVYTRTFNDVNEIVKVCNRLGINITGSVFKSNAAELENLHKLCEENGIDINRLASIFERDEPEARKIIDLCRTNNIPIAGSIFSKRANQLEASINYIKNNYNEKLLTPQISLYDVDHLKETFEFLYQKGVLGYIAKSSSILRLKYNDMLARFYYLEDNNCPITQNNKYHPIFGMNDKRMQERFGVTQQQLNEIYKARIEEATKTKKKAG